MLHLPTTLMILAVTVTLQGLVWLLVWLTQRHLFELRFMAAGFIAFAAGLLLLLLRGALPVPPAVFIIGQNYCIHLGLVLLSHGVARFLGQRGNPYLMWACAAVAIIFWPAALILAPAEVGLRIHVSNGLALVLIAFIIIVFLRDRSQPPLLRWTMIGILSTDVVALILRTVITIQSAPVDLLQDSAQVWYFFFFNIFITSLFLMLLLMVGVRLSSDLRQKNEALSREVAERRKLQDQLTATLETEQALRQEQRQFLRMVTHEFRTPLAVVDRAAEMIGVVLPDPPEPVTKRLRSIHEAVHRLLQLIERFLDAERRDLNVLQPERIDIRSLLASVQRHFEGMDAAHRLTFRADDALPFYRGDPDMLATVLINLIDNALKYAPDGSPVEIAARSESDAIILTVSDRGIGIPEAEMASIGRRFFRASNTIPATGTGLGLHNARRLLDYHDGLLSFRAGREGGTVAIIRLPLPGVKVPVEFSEAS